MPTIKTIFTNKNIFLFGLFLVMVGMPLSKFLMSVGQFVLLGNWILEGDFKRKWQVMKSSRSLWVITGFYLLHLLGLLWTSDFDYAANDLKIKLPLLWFPLLFISSQALEKKQVQALLWLYTTAVFIASIVCTLVWLGYTKHQVVDIRDISIFNSHIRFALMIDLSICFLVYDFFKTGRLYLFIIKAGLIIWLAVFLIIMQSFTGIVILAVVLFYFLVKFLANKGNKTMRFVPFILLMAAAGYFSYVFKTEIDNYTTHTTVKLSKLEWTTPNGNRYMHDTIVYKECENGNFVNVYVCTDEMRKEWNERSKRSFDSTDLKGNRLRITLVRYLASRNLRRDSMGVNRLEKEDIKNIERGVTNYKYAKGGLNARVYQFLKEYDAYENKQNASGHSVFMRFEFWKTGWNIIKNNWIIGVGTGDVQLAYNKQYQQMNSQLTKEWQRRSHNQFMAVTIAFGLVGLIVFLLYLFYPAFAIKQRHYLFVSFFIISLLSMLNEDTLETQAGVTFFGFFYCFLLFAAGKDHDTAEVRARIL